MTTVTDRAQEGRLTRVCAKAFAFAQRLRSARDPGTAQGLRDEVGKLLAEIDQDCSRLGFDPSASAAARYAIVALIDEIVLTSNWTLRDSWASRPLQLEHFDDYAAGEQFFVRLDQLRGATDPVRRDLLEVYVLCLGLGFRGKHGGVAGLETLQRLRKELAHELRDPAATPGLSPHWQPAEALPRLVGGVPVWIVAAACGGLLLVVYTVLALLTP